MDDYLGADGIKIRYTMDRFLDKYKNQYNILYKGYQLAIKKYKITTVNSGSQ